MSINNQFQNSKHGSKKPANSVVHTYPTANPFALINYDFCGVHSYHMISLPIKVINVQRARNGCFQKVVLRKKYLSLSLAFNSDENRTEHRYISSRMIERYWNRRILLSKPIKRKHRQCLYLLTTLFSRLALQLNVSFEFAVIFEFLSLERRVSRCAFFQYFFFNRVLILI